MELIIKNLNLEDLGYVLIKLGIPMQDIKLFGEIAEVTYLGKEQEITEEDDEKRRRDLIQNGGCWPVC